MPLGALVRLLIGSQTLSRDGLILPDQSDTDRDPSGTRIEVSTQRTFTLLALPNQFDLNSDPESVGQVHRQARVLPDGGHIRPGFKAQRMTRILPRYMHGPDIVESLSQGCLRVESIPTFGVGGNEKAEYD